MAAVVVAEGGEAKRLRANVHPDGKDGPTTGRTTTGLAPALLLRVRLDLAKSSGASGAHPPPPAPPPVTETEIETVDSMAAGSGAGPKTGAGGVTGDPRVLLKKLARAARRPVELGVAGVVGGTAKEMPGRRREVIGLLGQIA